MLDYKVMYRRIDAIGRNTDLELISASVLENDFLRTLTRLFANSLTSFASFPASLNLISSCVPRRILPSSLLEYDGLRICCGTDLGWMCEVPKTKGSWGRITLYDPKSSGTAELEKQREHLNLQSLARRSIVSSPGPASITAT